LSKGIPYGMPSTPIVESSAFTTGQANSGNKIIVFGRSESYPLGDSTGFTPVVSRGNGMKCMAGLKLNIKKFNFVFLTPLCQFVIISKYCIEGG